MTQTDDSHTRNSMRGKIRNTANQMDIELSGWCVEQIIDQHFHLLVNGRIHAAIQAYLRD
ncbi:MAG: hypothetical protein F6K19_36130 [Cyanothece sp. SIO1E1]|nr:hypothetical protein [Cyanothece sp. SIO1E1]